MIKNEAVGPQGIASGGSPVYQGSFSLERFMIIKNESNQKYRANVLPVKNLKIEMYNSIKHICQFQARLLEL